MVKTEAGVAKFPGAVNKAELLTLTGNCWNCGKNLIINDVDPKQQVTASVTCPNCDKVNTFSVQGINISP